MTYLLLDLHFYLPLLSLCSEAAQAEGPRPQVCLGPECDLLLDMCLPFTCCAAKLPKLKAPGQQASLPEQLAAADCPALTALQQQLRSQLRPRLQQQQMGCSSTEKPGRNTAAAAATAGQAAAASVCGLLQGLLLEDAVTASTGSCSTACQQTCTSNAHSWRGTGDGSGKGSEALVELPWQGLGGSSGTNSNAACAAEQLQGAGCSLLGPGRQGQQLASSAADDCDARGAGGDGGDRSATVEGLSLIKGGMLQSSASAAAGVGLIAANGMSGVAGDAVFSGHAAVAGCFVEQQHEQQHEQQQQCAGAVPDFMEWDSWYSGLAALVE